VSGKRWIWIVALAGVLVAIGGIAWSMQGQIAYARIATGYAAEQTCACLHVSGRPLDSCLGDFPADARRQISVAPEGQGVRASVLFGAINAEAHYEDGFGCTLQN
jgi:hypothetical protein